MDDAMRLSPDAVTAAPPRRPWHGRKRTWAALALWLVVVYPLSVGPLVYAAQRGWVSGWISGPFLLPARLAKGVPILGGGVERYERYWVVRALEDDGYTVEVAPNGDINANRSTIGIDVDGRLREIDAMIEASPYRDAASD